MRPQCTRLQATGIEIMNIEPELSVDEVIDQGVDEGGGHGHQVDSEVQVFNPSPFCNI